MANHWDRPGWNEDTRAYYWMLTFPGNSPLIKHMQQCQRALAHLDFDNIDADGLHLTLGRIGLVDDVTDDQLDQLTRDAQRKISGSFTLQAIPLTASRGAIRYSVAPWTPIVELHQTLNAIGAANGLPPHKPTTVLRPHIGLAYANRTLPADRVRTALRPLRELKPVDIPVHQVDLVELRREGRAYRWTNARCVHLAPSEGDGQAPPTAI
ncbi:2'-5' RNA ligase family protein [Streptomyces sp. NPDC023838]|uniref:2'-5' RNA ligase family protein n=1 Tax=Streptomyces sp. NPDC023838 TaxID=3154325 RepID=UPI0033E921C6